MGTHSPLLEGEQNPTSGFHVNDIFDVRNAEDFLPPFPVIWALSKPRREDLEFEKVLLNVYFKVMLTRWRKLAAFQSRLQEGFPGIC